MIPHNWYAMSWDQQRDWEQNEERHRRELRDADDRAQSLADDEALHHQRRLSAARSEMAGLRCDYDNLSNDYDGACATLRRAEAFIASKGLTSEYAAWEELPSEAT